MLVVVEFFFLHNLLHLWHILVRSIGKLNLRQICFIVSCAVNVLPKYIIIIYYKVKLSTVMLTGTEQQLRLFSMSHGDWSYQDSTVALLCRETYVFFLNHHNSFYY